MIHRIFLFSLIAASTASIAAMDAEHLVTAEKLLQKSQSLTAITPEQFLAHANGTLETMNQMFG